MESEGSGRSSDKTQTPLRNLGKNSRALRAKNKTTFKGSSSSTSAIPSNNSSVLDQPSRYCDGLMEPSQHIDKVMNTDEVEKQRIWLKMIIQCVRYIAVHALAFHGQDEYSESDDEYLDPGNRGLFGDLVKLLATFNDKVDVGFLENSLESEKYISKDMQKEILQMLVNKVRNKISEEVGNAKFSILIDEAQSQNFTTRAGIILRFVDDEGFVQERLFEAVDVENTTGSTIKEELSNVLARHNLHINNMRGHGYDGALGMRNIWNGLQTSLLKDCPYAYYVHWFAHPLQHALVEACQEVYEVYFFFKSLSSIMDLVGPSSKDHSLLQSAQADEISRKLAIDGPETGKEANHIGSHCCPHFRSVSSLIDTFNAYCTVIESLVENGSNPYIRSKADEACYSIISFQFVFILHLLHRLMGVTEILCQALQQKPLDILKVKNLVSTTKARLQDLRQDGWETFLESVNLCCDSSEEYIFDIPDMNASHTDRIRRSCQQEDITVGNHYRINIFNSVIDLHLAELNNRFSEGAMELLLLSSALDPRDAFKSFKIDDICSLAEKFYSQNFTEHEIPILRTQLQQYKLDVIHHPEFQNLSTVSELCRRLVETGKSKIYSLIDRLIHLVLILPTFMATTERTYLASKFIKEALCNKMEDEFINNCMIINVERELAENIDLDLIVDDVISLMEHKEYVIASCRDK